jgi:hypothetical protein
MAARKQRHDDDRISRCGDCGAWTWDGECHTPGCDQDALDHYPPGDPYQKALADSVTVQLRPGGGL